MKYKYNRDISWPNIAGCKAKLTRLEQGTEKPSFEEFEADLLKRNTSQKNELLYNKWLAFCDYLDHFCGLCKVGEQIELVGIDANVLVLSKDWRGNVSDHSDLEAWLRRSRESLFSLHTVLTCEIYSFGTIAGAPAGSQDAFFGGGSQPKRVSHLVGTYLTTFDNFHVPTLLELRKVTGAGGSTLGSFKIFPSRERAA